MSQLGTKNFSDVRGKRLRNVSFPTTQRCQTREWKYEKNANGWRPRLLARRGSRSRKSPERGPDVKVVRLLVHKPRPGGRRRVELRRARWQINCEPCADGLIHLSCRYKRLSRSNFILRFWLSHPDSFEPLRPLPFLFHSAERFSIRPAQRDEIPRYRREFFLSVGLCWSLRSRLCPLPSAKLHGQLLKTAYRILPGLGFFSVRVRVRTYFFFLFSFLFSFLTLPNRGWIKRNWKREWKKGERNKEGKDLRYLQLNAAKKKRVVEIVMISPKLWLEFFEDAKMRGME